MCVMSRALLPVPIRPRGCTLISATRYPMFNSNRVLFATIQKYIRVKVSLKAFVYPQIKTYQLLIFVQKPLSPFVIHREKPKNIQVSG